MNGVDALAGVLRLRPGQACPHGLSNERPDWAGRLARGRLPAELPGLLASVYSLCGHAQRMCAQLALRAAGAGDVGGDAAAARSLQRETLAEHLRRIGLDWPAALAGAASDEALLSLRSCPLLRRPDAGLADTRQWLERHLLGMPATGWLERWEREPGWWSEWSTSADGWLPRLLREARPAADWPLVAAQPLHLHAGAAPLRQLAASLRADPGYTRQPRWQNDCAETGCWTRLHEAGRPMPATPWQRLGARVAELVRLALPDAPDRGGNGWLAFGALCVADGEGLAWVEMARGLLVHHAVLEPASGRVVAYRVLAPTEWNFHAEGAVARALEGLRPAAPGRIAALMAAYDPCVRFEVETQVLEEERAHA